MADQVCFFHEDGVLREVGPTWPATHSGGEGPGLDELFAEGRMLFIRNNVSDLPHIPPVWIWSASRGSKARKNPGVLHEGWLRRGCNSFLPLPLLGSWVSSAGVPGALGSGATGPFYFFFCFSNDRASTPNQRQAHPHPPGAKDLPAGTASRGWRCETRGLAHAARGPRAKTQGPGRRWAAIGPDSGRDSKGPVVAERVVHKRCISRSDTQALCIVTHALCIEGA